jgi:tetratricopeptide (TPR) repeat protein/tRNA A-37 threonylcarbamoyl transferase component Bud32
MTRREPSPPGGASPGAGSAAPGRREAGAESDEAGRWRQVRALVDAALELPAPARAAFLERASADAAVRADAARWLAGCERADGAGDFLVQPMAERAVSLLPPCGGAPRVEVASAESARAIAAPPATLRAALADRYEVEREIGRGGMATVYVARDLRHHRRVAVKVLHPELSAALGAERFLREIELTASLQHPHILPLFDSGTADGWLFSVMPLVEGETLRERLARQRQLSVSDALRLMREVASALAHAHRHGVVHRDIKPANILLADGHAVVADFGIARAVHQAREVETPASTHAGTRPMLGRSTDTLTGAGTSPGTPAYMAPEQAHGRVTVDHRADLYALGVVAYEALAGGHPYGVRAGQAILEAHDGDAPPTLLARRPDVPPALAALVTRLLARDPARRPPTAEAVLDMLEGVPAQQTAAARRGRRAALSVTAAVLLLSSVAGYAAWRRAPVSVGRAAGAPAASDAPAVDAPRGTADQAAYDLYLQGRYHWLRRGPENVTRAIAFFRQATARDPTFARAHAGLAMAYGVLPLFVPDAADSLAALTMASAQRAVALDSTLADAQLALGNALEMRLRLREGQARYRAAVALDPSSATAHQWLGMNLLVLGETDAALAELRHARELDPLAVMPATAVATALLFARRFPEAAAASRRALTLDSTFAFAIWSLGLAQTLGGQADSAVRTLERGTHLHPGYSRLSAALVFAYASAGRWSDAARIRAQLHRTENDPYGGSAAGLADLVFGDPEPLVYLLTTKAGQRRYVNVDLLGCNPLLDPLWADARFRAAMRRLTLEPCRSARPWPLPPRPGVKRPGS